jgi:probable HAF family extracellular repeat protein
MKFMVATLAACCLLVSLATAQAGSQLAARRQGRLRYTVKDLGPVDNPFSQAAAVSNDGLVAGIATAPDGTTHAVLWRGGRIKTSVPPGFNSAPFGLNERARAWSS